MAGTANYTAQQRAAIETTGVSIGLSAGAGCGKTFVLTQRFLKELAPGPRPIELTSLVAITFTDRAAREMRDRVREACQQRLDHADSAEADHWLRVLRGLDTARISTIHSFCTSLLRANAVEAALDPGFAVLEPPLAKTLLDQAAETVVHAGLIADDPDVVPFVVRWGLERTRDLMGQLIGQRFRVDWSSPPEVDPASLATRWLTTWRSEYVPRLLTELREGELLAGIVELLRGEIPDHAEMRRRRDTILRLSADHNAWAEPDKVLAELRDAAKVQGGGGKSVWSSIEVFESIRDRFEPLRNAISALQKKLVIDETDVALSAEFACRGWRVARQGIEIYESLKRRAGALDFDDLLLKARDLLRAHPAVRERFARNIALLMVDEFQDTDPVQAEIVRALCGAALRHGKLFLVGDIKQSIYRFRRADPEVFRGLRDELPAPGRLSLTKNFRSQPAILDFVNFLFHDEFPQYEPLEPFRAEQLSPVPAIEFLWADSPAEGPPPEGKPSVQDLRTWEAEWLARRIAELLADETPRVRSRDRATGQITLRRVRPGDITILFRALSDVQTYESALRRQGLDYYLVGGKAFFAQQEVYDLLNLCRCLADPDDVVALLGVLRSPWFGLTDDAIHALHPADGDWDRRLTEPPPAWLPEFQQARIRFAGTLLTELRRIKDQLSIAELLRRAITATGYDAALLAEHLGSRKVANLRKLIELAEPFDRGEQFTLADYLDRLRDAVLQETDEEFATTLPESGEVIRLMSIHQSKGLEFPLVCVVDLDRQSPPPGFGAYLHPAWGALVKLPEEFGREREHLGLKMLRIDEQAAEAEETLRLFYVAITRAADHLILSTGYDPGAKRHAPWMELLGRHFDLSTGLPLGDPLLGTTQGVNDRRRIPEVRVHHEPPRGRPSQTVERRPSLKSFISRLEEAMPEPWPIAAEWFGHDPAAPRTFSVSQLESLDAQLRAAELGPANASEPGPRASSLTVDEATALGTLIHETLERLDYHALDAWEPVYEQVRRRQPEPITPAIDEEARGMLARWVTSPYALEWSQAESFQRELDLLLPVGAAPQDLVSGQIDACLKDDHGWRLYDFKTTNVPPGPHDAALLREYSFQLGVYTLAAEAWWGRPIAELGLILLRPTVRVVTLPWDDAQRTVIWERIRAGVAAARTAS